LERALIDGSFFQVLSQATDEIGSQGPLADMGFYVNWDVDFLKRREMAISRREGLILPIEYSDRNTITTLPPQDALDDFMKDTYATQINTYEIGES